MAGNELLYATHLGGGGEFGGKDIAVDKAGNAYVVGETKSSDFPTTAGAFQIDFGGTRESCAQPSTAYPDAYISKLNAAGSGLVYSTYLGGCVWDSAEGLTLDDERIAYVTGITRSHDFPTTDGAFDQTLNGGADTFVAKVTPNGDALIYSSYLGGINTDGGIGIVVAPTGIVHMVGMTKSLDFPTVDPIQEDLSRFNGGAFHFDASVSTLSADGSQLLFSTYLGGFGEDKGNAIALDSSLKIYVAGDTESPNFPILNALQNEPSEFGDAFIAIIGPAPEVVKSLPWLELLLLDD